ncbi:Uma2 family endonuclease [soil metagenome]
MTTQIEERPETLSAMIIQAEHEPLVLRFGPLLKQMSEDEFFDFCQLNRDLRIERTSEGDIIIMPPTGAETGGRNFNLTVIFGAWVKQDGTGKGFDSSTGFTLPNGAVRSPDLAWVRQERWNALPAKQRKKFAPLCPDFVAEIRSETDSLKSLQEKMEEYIANGAQLGWLFDPQSKKVYVYRPQANVKILDNPQTLSGEPLLRGFELNVQDIWD